MQNSSDSLFHFTDNIAVINSILSDKFFGSYCKEVLNYNGEIVLLYVPMISFCDIPIKTYSNLGAVYGKYGIGLSKKWAIEKKLNPVLYIDKNSALLDNFIKSLKGSLTTVQIAAKILADNAANAELTKNLTDSVEYLTYSLYHTKHYQDILIRDGKQYEDYRFYDEREWRYLPEFKCAVCELRKSEEEYQKWRQQSSTKPLLSEVVLDFKPQDIEHILVKSEKDIDEMIETIHKLPDEKFGEYKKEKLITKIICFEKVERDF